MPVLEAMACGTPVVTSDASSLPEVAGDAGVLTTPGDDAELAAAMMELVGAAGRRAELREKGLAQARKFSWDVAAERCREAYRLAAGRA